MTCNQHEPSINKDGSINCKFCNVLLKMSAFELNNPKAELIECNNCQTVIPNGTFKITQDDMAECPNCFEPILKANMVTR